jgi:hypothetical protein
MCRFLTIYVTQDDSLRLIAKITSSGLCKSNCEPWTIFRSSGVRLTNAAVDLFATYLTKYTISENVTSANRRTSDTTLRNVLLSWLIPSKAEQCSYEDFILAPVHLNAQRLAAVAVVLTLRDSRCGIDMCGQHTKERTAFRDIEQSYLLSTFDSTEIQSFVSETENRLQHSERNCILCNVKEKLLEKVVEDLDYAIPLASPEVSYDAD